MIEAEFKARIIKIALCSSKLTGLLANLEHNPFTGEKRVGIAYKELGQQIESLVGDFKAGRLVPIEE